MYFAQFYNRKLDGTLDEAVGDRSVIILDGRQRASFGTIAATEAVKRGYEAYSIHHGDSFTRSTKLSGPWGVPGKPDTTAASATYGA